MAFGGHARVGQNLSDRVFGGWVFFTLIGFAQGFDVVQRVVVADVLESIGDGLDKIFLLDRAHGFSRAGEDG